MAMGCVYRIFDLFLRKRKFALESACFFSDIAGINVFLWVRSSVCIKSAWEP